MWQVLNEGSMKNFPYYLGAKNLLINYMPILLQKVWLDVDDLKLGGKRKKYVILSKLRGFGLQIDHSYEKLSKLNFVHMDWSFAHAFVVLLSSLSQPPFSLALSLFCFLIHLLSPSLFSLLFLSLSSWSPLAVSLFTLCSLAFDVRIGQQQHLYNVSMVGVKLPKQDFAHPDQPFALHFLLSYCLALLTLPTSSLSCFCSLAFDVSMANDDTSATFRWSVGFSNGSRLF